MKKIILIVALLMLSVTSYGQFGKWSASGEYGMQMVGDKTAVSVDNFDHFGLGLRYNISEIIGVGLTSGYDKTILSEDNGLTEYDFKYLRFNAEGYINTFKWVDVYSKRFTVLLHGGPGISFLNGDGYKQTVLNFRGGVTVLYKISNKLAITGDFSTTSNVNQTMKLDGSGPSVNTGINSNVSNASIGLTFYLNKKNKKHADWYNKPKDTTTTINLTHVVNRYNTYPTVRETNIEQVIKNVINNSDESQFVFFDNAKHNIKDTEYNAIYRAYHALDIDKDKRLIIIGYASATKDSDEKNQKLSERRTNELKTYIIDMGIDPSRITFDSKGKDNMRAKENVFGIARRVELLIVKDIK